MKILMIGHIPAVHDMLNVAFRLHYPDCECINVTTGREGLRALLEHHPDLVLLEIDPPEGDGLRTLEAMRRHSSVPIVVGDSEPDELTHLRALESGADDYVGLSTSHLVLIARMRAVMRRARPGDYGGGVESDLACGPLCISPRRHLVSVRGVPISLTPVEFKLLLQLARNDGNLVPHQVLIERVWGTDVIATPAHLKVVVSRLRAKLERVGADSWIETERGIGYRLAIVPDRAIAPPPAGVDAGVSAT